jgi:tetratricopeptide (TPR) repeat protein
LENDHTTLQYDMRYRQALDHLQAGRWNDAIVGFEALVQDYPDNANLQRVIEEARLKASRDSTKRIRVRRWQISWRLVIFRVLAAVTILGVVAAGVWLVSQGVLPALAQARVARQHAQLLIQGNAYLAAEDLDRAEASFKALLTQVPESVDAQKGLADVQTQREIQKLYQQAVTAQDRKDYPVALQALNELTVKSPGYRDINSRIATITKQQQIETLFTQAETAFNAGQNQEAMDGYLQVRTLSATYQTDVITERLFTTYVRMGRALVEERPPVPEDIPQALAYFTDALALKPRDLGTMQEQRLADLFNKGQIAYQDERWHDATVPLRAVYDSRADYLGTVTVNMLYDAYIRSGDLYVQEGDIYRAYDDYLNASHLPLPDLTLAKGRLAQITPNITPSPTPMPTSTPRPTSVGGSGGGGAAKPTPTPRPSPTPTPYNLAALRNRIVYRSSNPGQPGLWVVDPDGNNRQYLGNSPELDRAYDDLLRQYQLSPDKRSLVVVMGPKDTAQIYLALPDGSTTRQLTNTRGASYDPSWSPDGTRIIYVSEDTGSDDIWSMAPDGSDARDLTPNKDYDKHPSWSPDNRSVAFWSSRAGLSQIFVMDADGKNVRNISNSPWDEIDPLWIR